MKTDTDGMTVRVDTDGMTAREWKLEATYHWGVADGLRRARRMAQDMALHEMAQKLTLQVHRAADRGNSCAEQARNLMAIAD